MAFGIENPLNRTPSTGSVGDLIRGSVLQLQEQANRNQLAANETLVRSALENARRRDEMRQAVMQMQAQRQAQNAAVVQNAMRDLFESYTERKAKQQEQDWRSTEAQKQRDYETEQGRLERESREKIAGERQMKENRTWDQKVREAAVQSGMYSPEAAATAQISDIYPELTRSERGQSALATLGVRFEAPEPASLEKEYSKSALASVPEGLSPEERTVYLSDLIAGRTGKQSEARKSFLDGLLKSQEALSTFTITPQRRRDVADQAIIWYGNNMPGMTPQERKDSLAELSALTGLTLDQVGGRLPVLMKAVTPDWKEPARNPTLIQEAGGALRGLGGTLGAARDYLFGNMRVPEDVRGPGAMSPFRFSPPQLPPPMPQSQPISGTLGNILNQKLGTPTSLPELIGRRVPVVVDPYEDVR